MKALSSLPLTRPCRDALNRMRVTTTEQLCGLSRGELCGSVPAIHAFEIEVALANKGLTLKHGDAERAVRAAELRSLAVLGEKRAADQRLVASVLEGVRR